MKNSHSLTHLHGILILSVALAFAPTGAKAASAIWNGSPTDGNWEATTSENNWSTDTTPGSWPGGTSTSSTDTATFNTNSSFTAITIGLSAWNVKNVVFDTTNCAAYTINSTEGNASARWTGGGAITINGSVTNSQVFSGNQFRLHAGGGLSLINNATNAKVTLTFSAGIKANNSTSANLFDQVISLQGTNTGKNTFSGVIADYTTPAAGQWASLIKTNSGTWYLTANNTYTGPTVITGGTLFLRGAGAINATTNVIVNGAGATLDFTNAMNLTTANNYMFVTNSGTLQITNTVNQTPVTVANLVVSNATIHMGVNGSAPFTDISVTSALNAGPNVTLAIDQIASLSSATMFTLISYAGPDPSAANFTVTVPTGYSAGSVTVGGGTVTVTITPPSSTSLVWVGATNSVLVSNWDTNKTPNWVDAATLSIPQAYANPDSVQFDDSALTNIVNLITTNTPNGVTVINNNFNYTFEGNGKISGSSSLNKQGNDSLTLAETGGDDFSGGITVSGGTLILDDANSAIGGGLAVSGGATVQIGNNDGNGNLSSGGTGVDVEGTLIFSRTNNVLVSTPISGGGALMQSARGTVTFNSANSYTGNTIVGPGTLALTGAGTISNSASVLFSNATFDVSGLGGQTTLLNTLTVTNTTFNTAISGAQPSAPINVLNGFSADGIVSVSNVINITSLPVIASYPVTLNVIKLSSGTISLTGGNFNFVLGSLPSGGYAGSIVESADQTAVQLTLTSGPTGVRSSVLWIGTDNVSATTNWSDRLNWQLPGAPTSIDNVFFNNTGVVAAGTVNNFVDQNFTLVNLTYTNLGNGNYHVTDIPAGVTLTVTNFTVGGLTADGAISDVAYTDGGTLIVNGSTLTIGNNGSASTDTGSILDLSGLSNFVYNAASGTINVGTGNRSSANFKLAGLSNSITAGTWNANALSSSSTASGTLTLGAGTNNLNVGTFNAAIQRNSCTVQFPAGSTGNGLRLRGTAGTDSSRTTMTLGNRNASGSGGTSTATLSFNGYPVDMKLGTLTMGEASAVTANTGTAVINFDTGTIDATTINMAVVNIAGATANGTITIGASGTLIVGTGGLSLANNTAGTSTGTLTINGGSVICSNSVVKTTAAGTGNITLTDGHLKMISGTIGTSAAPIDTLSLSDNGTLDTILQLNGNPNVASVVANSVTASGTTTINIGSIAGVTASSPVPVIIPLINYVNGTDPGLSSFTLGSVPAGYTGGTLIDNGTSLISLSITPPTALAWVGAVGSTLNSNWDTSTPDWKNSGSAVAYADPEFAQFDDTASNSTVTLGATLSPTSIAITNNALNYLLNGSGNISGTAGLVKNGSGKATLAETGGDNFTGGIIMGGGTLVLSNTGVNISGGLTITNGTLTLAHSGTISGGLSMNNTAGGSPSAVIIGSGTLSGGITAVGNLTISNSPVISGGLTNGGSVLLDQTSTISGNTTNANGATIQVGNNDANGSLPSGSVVNNGSLVFNQSANTTVSNIISGAGSLSQSGNAILTLSGANTLTGAVTVVTGTLKAGSGTALGGISDSVTVSSGATLDDGGQNLSAYTNITVSGSGVNGNGAIVNNSGTDQATAFGHLTLAGNTTFGGTNRWDLRLAGGSLLTGGQPYSITKVGTNQVSLVDVINIDQALSNIVVQSGTFAVQQIGANGLGTNGAITVFSNATFEVDFGGENLTNLTKPIVLLDGATLLSTSAAESINDPITLSTNTASGTGNCTFNITGTSMTLSNTVSGSGNLIKTGSSNLVLTAASSYTGNTTVSAGKLTLTGSGSIASPTTTLASGTTLDVSGRANSTLTLNSGQTLAGGGTVNGSVTNLSGSTVSPTGVLTVTNNVTLNGNTLLKLNGSTNDVLSAGSALTYGGTLTLTNTSATPLAAGNTFKLFSAGNYSGAFSNIVTQPSLASGLIWTNNGNGVFSLLSSGPGTFTNAPGGLTFSLNGGNVVITGTGGQAGDAYYLLASTNVALPLSQWTVVATNVLGANGSFTFTGTNAVTPGDAQQFYILSNTNSNHQ